jgi:hypothetical protein
MGESPLLAVDLDHRREAHSPMFPQLLLPDIRLEKLLEEFDEST